MSKFRIREVTSIKLIDAKTGEELKSIPERQKSEDEFYKIEIAQIHKLLDLYTKNKEIELGKTYYTCEWSWQPICDGIFVYEEIIRDYKIVEGIDVYFTNKNYRMYLKEDLYENKSDAQKMCNWQNSFGYDYDSKISRLNLVRKHLKYETIGGNVIWTII